MSLNTDFVEKHITTIAAMMVVMCAVFSTYLVSQGAGALLETRDLAKENSIEIVHIKNSVRETREYLESEIAKRDLDVNNKTTGRWYRWEEEASQREQNHIDAKQNSRLRKLESFHEIKSLANAHL